jgi:hypothetical protein
MLFVNQDKSVSWYSLLELNQGLVDLSHRPEVNPGLNTLLICQLNHISDLLGGSDQRSSDLQSTSDQGESADSRKLILRGADLDEDPVSSEELEVTSKRHVGSRNSGNDQVQALGMGGSPVRVLVGRDVKIGTHSEGVSALRGLAGDSNDLVSAKRTCEENSEMSKTSESNNSDALSGTATVADKGGVDGDTSAHHGGEDLAGEGDVGKLDDEVGGDTGVVGVSSEGLVAALVFRPISSNEAGALGAG